MQVDEKQSAVVYALLKEIKVAISAGDADGAAGLAQSAMDVMTGLPVGEGIVDVG
jgi:hypothetical protein